MVDRVLGGGRLTDDADARIGLEDRPQPKPDHLVIVGDQQPHVCRLHPAISLGKIAVNRVPAPGVLASSRWPPSSRTRSSMLCRPWPCSMPGFERLPGANPRPSS